MFGHRVFGAAFYGPRYFGAGGDIAVAVPVAETPSGGWARKTPTLTVPRSKQGREETETEREARIKAERIRMGILPAEPAPDMQPDGPGLSTGLSTTDHIGDAGNMVGAPLYTLAAHLLPGDLAGLEALAARAAQLTIDQEIALWLRLEEQRRLHEAWLRDEDDAAVLMLAIATIH